MNEQALWPDETDHSEQTRERERLQSEIQEAWFRLMNDRDISEHEGQLESTEDDIKLLKWRLGL